MVVVWSNKTYPDQVWDFPDERKTRKLVKIGEHMSNCGGAPRCKQRGMIRAAAYCPDL